MTNCPVPSGSFNQPTKRSMHCTRGFTACPRFTGRDGWDCVDTRADAEMCGGCVKMDDPESETPSGKGRDCTALPNVSIVQCKKSQCVVESCRKGYEVSEDQTECVRSSGAGGMLGSLAGLYFPQSKRQAE